MPPPAPWWRSPSGHASGLRPARRHLGPALGPAGHPELCAGRAARRPARPAHERRRAGPAASTSSCVWPCKDGFVSITFLFGDSIGPFTRRLMNWIHEEGYCDEATRDKDWIDYANQLYDGREPISEYERLKGIVGEFCADQDQGRAARGGVRADPADRSGRHARRRRAAAPSSPPATSGTTSTTTAARDRPGAARPARGVRSIGRRRRSASAGRPASASTPTRCSARRRARGAAAPTADGGATAPAAGGRQGARPDVGDGRAADDPGDGRLRRHRRPRRVERSPRRGPHDRAVRQRHARATTRRGCCST